NLFSCDLTALIEDVPRRMGQDDAKSGRRRVRVFEDHDYAVAMSRDARARGRATVNHGDGRVEHLALVHRVREENSGTIAGLEEVDEIDVPTRRIIGDTRRRAIATAAPLIARVDFKRWVPASPSIGRALQ